MLRLALRYRAPLARATVWSVLFLASVPASPRAQTPDRLSLQGVIDAALTGNTQIRNERLRAEGSRGQLITRSGPFDVQVQSTVQQSQDKKLITPDQFALEHGTTYQIALVRQLHSGITLSPTVQVTSSRYALPGALTYGSASAALKMVVPLMYDRGGAVTTTAVRVAELDFETVMGSWRATVSTGVNAAVNAYWEYVASIDGLSVQRDAESRAQQLLDRTTQLVEKQERAASDLQQLRATVAARRSARILAEQTVDQARVQLGTLMGLDAANVLAIGAPATAFPQPVDAMVSSPASIARLEELARTLRPDLAAQRVSNRAWELELEQFRRAQQPRFDLNINVGYEGYTQGPGHDQLVSPLYRNVPGLNATVQLQYAVDVANSAARGRVVSEEASVNQQRLALRDAERQIVTDVRLAALGVDRGTTALRESETAVALFRVSVGNEQRKLQLGMNTLFDVLNAEEALTNALLTAINNRRSYAVGLSMLRLATGTFADLSGAVPSVDAARLLTQP
ncbi:MAG: TolC family protein [bacterium]